MRFRRAKYTKETKKICGLSRLILKAYLNANNVLDRPLRSKYSQKHEKIRTALCGRIIMLGDITRMQPLLDKLSHRMNVRRVIVAGIAGWVTLASLVAAHVFSSDRPAELGYEGFCVLLTIILSVFYLADFVLFTVIFYSVFRRRLLSVRLWLRSVIGALLFTVTVPLWGLTVGDLRAYDMLLLGGIALVVGLVSFFVLSVKDEMCDTVA